MKRYFLIGERLGHSCSPELHRAFGRYEYELKELSPGELGAFLQDRQFAGLNVTIPYKEAVIPYLDRMDPMAAAIGAVNTVVNREGTLWGYNTDYDGMKACLEHLILPGTDRHPHGEGQPLAGSSVLILGTGGSSKTALALCRDLGAARIARVSRTGKEGALRYEEAAARFGPRPAASASPAAYAPGNGLEQTGGTRLLLINCTPVGMWPEAEGCPLDLARLVSPPARQSGEVCFSLTISGVFDCVYNPLRTRLVLEAQALGVPAAGGLEMLVRQAAKACQLFTGAPVEETDVRSVYKALLARRENLVLIGMPGAGKSTLARLLAQKTGREFVDIDEKAQEIAEKPIPSIFAEDGESAFRALEASIVQGLAEGGGRVIAAGGGTVLRRENLLRLKQNGRLIFLDRPLAALEPSPERPLGDTAEKLARLYAERYGLYAAAADLRIDNSGSPEEALRRILEAL